MLTVKEWLEQHGRSFPESDADGTIGSAAFEKLGLPMVVSCTNCGMTLVMTSRRRCSKGGYIYCDNCAEGEPA